MKLSEILDGAIDHIRKNGWCRNIQRDAEGRCCVAGAINMAQSGYVYTECEGFYPALDAVGKVAQELGLTPSDSLPGRLWAIEHKDAHYAVEYNNNYCKDADEMIATMEKARAHLQEAGQ